MNDTSFVEKGHDSDFEDEGDTSSSSSSSSSCEDLVQLEKMVEELDLLYFETNLMRNNIAHFEYFYNTKRKQFRTIQSCPGRLELVYNNHDDWIDLNKIE